MTSRRSVDASLIRHASVQQPVVDRNFVAAAALDCTLLVFWVDLQRFVSSFTDPKANRNGLDWLEFHSRYSGLGSSTQCR